MAEIVSLSEAIVRSRARRRHGRDGRLHPPDPPRRGTRGDPATAPRPDAGPDDPGRDLRPDDRRRVRAQAGLLLGRQPGRRVAAPVPGRGRARLARPARDRGAQPRRDGQPLRGRRVRAAVRGAARLPRHRPGRPDRASPRSSARSPASGWRRWPRCGPDVADHPRAAGRPRRATSSSGGSPACRRRRCSPPRASVVTVEEIVDELRPAARRGRAAGLGGRLRGRRARRRAPLLRAGLLDRDNDFYVAWDAISRRPRRRSPPGSTSTCSRRWRGVTPAAGTGHVHGRRDDDGHGRRARCATA